MKNLFNPKWLLIINTLPICILFFILYQEYSIIYTLLNEENIRYGLIFGLSLVGLATINLLYALFLINRKKEISPYYAGFCLLVYIAWIYLYTVFYDNVIPRDIPWWMLSGYIFVYVNTFLMPTLAFAILLLVAVFTRKPEKRPVWVNLVIVVLIPALSYLWIMVLLPMCRLNLRFLSSHFWIISFIMVTLIFLFFVCRSIYVIAARKSYWWKKLELLWKIPLTIVLPVIGLFLNSGGESFFGAFDHIGFYILAVLNGILLCLPNLANKTYRIVLYLLRCATFSFSIYFFVVFLPFLPLSVIAIIIAGTGFLMLSPLLIFFIHVNQLHADFCYLKQKWSPVRMITWGVLGALVIPTTLSISFIHDKEMLKNKAIYFNKFNLYFLSVHFDFLLEKSIFESFDLYSNCLF